MDSLSARGAGFMPSMIGEKWTEGLAPCSDGCTMQIFRFNFTVKTWFRERVSAHFRVPGCPA